MCNIDFIYTFQYLYYEAFRIVIANANKLKNPHMPKTQ